MTNSEDTPAPLPKKKRGNPATLAPAWKPGQSGNPQGRPKGARSKFSQDFVLDVAESWSKHGKTVLEDIVVEDPSTYLRTVCAILPKVIDFDEEVKDILAAAAGVEIPFSKIREKLEKK